MKIHCPSVLLVCIGLVIAAMSAAAESEPRPVLTHKHVTMTQHGVDGRIIVAFTTVAAEDGRATVELIPLDVGRQAQILDVPGVRSRTVDVRRGQSFSVRWSLRISGDGYHQFFNVRSHADIAKDLANRYVADAITPLYATLARGVVVKQACSLDPTFLADVLESGRSPNAVRGAVTLVGKEDPSVPRAQATALEIHLHGMVRYREDRTSSWKGIPNVKVHLDWDSDDDPTVVLQAPYSPHAVTTTRFDGTYDFHFIFDADRPAREYAHWLRLTVEACNDAARGNQLSCGGRFPHNLPIDISAEDYSIVNLAADINVEDPNNGGALRHLYRARYVAAVLLGFIPPQIVFFQDDTEPASHFVTSASWRGRNYPHIVFNQYPNAGIGYHEYGHYVESRVTGELLSSDCPNNTHWFRGQTAEHCAWNEGWGEAFDALAHMTLYAFESPAVIEPESFGEIGEPDVPEGLYQVLDCSERHLFADRSGTLVEGAVACFFHGLFDNPAPRAPGFSGDNDDLGDPYGYPGSDLHSLMVYRELYTGAPIHNYMWYGLIPWMKKFYPVTWLYHSLSTYAQYRHLIDHVGIQRSATPTTLKIELLALGPQGPFLPRLQWNDNTEPATVTYASGEGGARTFDLAENQEDGFEIWRRKLPARSTPWDGRDGRLDPNYMRVGVVGRNVNQWTDVAPLTKGTYRYVVVAYNQSNLDTASIPKAEAVVTIGARGIDVKHDDHFATVKIIHPGETEHLIVETDFVNPHYHWIADSMPSYLSLSGVESNALSITNAYRYGIDPIELKLFNVRCVVSDAGGSDTSLPYYPLYVPQDLATTILSVYRDGAFSVDTTPHGLRFIDPPVDDAVSTHVLGIRPTSDSGMYRLMLHGMVGGTVRLDMLVLYSVDHPADVAIGGNQSDGFYAYKIVDNHMVIDSNDVYLVFNELPLMSARTARGIDWTEAIRTFDLARFPLGSHDTLMCQFANVPPGKAVWDTAARGRTRDFVLEMRGNYSDDEGTPSTSTVVPAGSGAADFVVALGTVYPNPTSGSLAIPYNIGRAAHVRLVLFNTRGEQVRMVVNQAIPAGSHVATVNVSDLPSGVYYCVMMVDGRMASQAITLTQ